MDINIALTDIYQPSDDIVSREIEGENLIIPIAAGVGDMEDELYSLNEFGKVIWDKLDGEKSLMQVAAEIVEEYDGDAQDIQGDVIHFVAELAKRNILVKV